MASTSPSVSTSDPYAGKTTWTFMRHGEGLAAGLIGAITIAVWFFILDAIKGRPFYTPSVLGTVVFKGMTSSEALQQPGTSFEMVLAFTWFHVLVFCALGWIAGWFVQRAEESPHFGYGIALLIVFLLCGFIVACLIFAEPVLHTLTMPAILVGNVLAVLAMGIFFWRRHPRLKMLP